MEEVHEWHFAVSLFMPVDDRPVTRAHEELQHGPHHGLEIQQFAQLARGPCAEQGRAGPYHGRLESRVPSEIGVVEGEVVQPDPIASAAHTETFVFTEEPAGGTVLFGAAPVGQGIEVCPGIGDLSHMEELLEEGKRLRRAGSRDVGELRGVVGHDGNGGRKGPELAFGGVEEDGETLLQKMLGIVGWLWGGGLLTAGRDSRL